MSSSWKLRWWINLGREAAGALTVNIDGAGDEYIPARRETLTCAQQWILITDSCCSLISDDCSLAACRVSRKNWLIVDHPLDCWWLGGLKSDYNRWNKHDEYAGIRKWETHSTDTFPPCKRYHFAANLDHSNVFLKIWKFMRCVHCTPYPIWPHFKFW